VDKSEAVILFIVFYHIFNVANHKKSVNLWYNLFFFDFKVFLSIQVTPIANAIHSTYVAICLNYVAKAYNYVSNEEFYTFASPAN